MRPIFALLCASMMASSVASCASRPSEPEPIPPQVLERVKTDLISRLDFDRDGVITCGDALVRRQAIFATLDGDGDGRIGALAVQEARFDDNSYIFFDLQKLDADVSGDLTFDEFNAAPFAPITNMDRNEDCIVDDADIDRFIREERFSGAITPGERRPRRPGDTRDLPPPVRKPLEEVDEIDDIDDIVGPDNPPEEDGEPAPPAI